MTYDSQRGRTVMFGGNSSGVPETWEWDGATWTQVATTGPSVSYAMAYDSQRGRTVLFGGDASGVPETWEWNGASWSQVSPATQPPSLYGHAMAYDSQRARVLLFGGRLYGGLILRDTWDFGQPLATAHIYGTGCGSPALDLAPLVSARPIIGTTGQAVLTNVPSSLAFVALGWSRSSFGGFNLPLSLAGFGMPGCDLLQSAEAAAVPTTITGPSTATFGLPLPNLAGLIGLTVYLQGWAVAPGYNPGHTIVSNGIVWRIGAL
jgi:hypothetical protein